MRREYIYINIYTHIYIYISSIRLGLELKLDVKFPLDWPTFNVSSSSHDCNCDSIAFNGTIYHL